MNRLKNYFNEIIPSIIHVNKINGLYLHGYALEMYEEYKFEAIYTAFVQADSITVETHY